MISFFLLACVVFFSVWLSPGISWQWPQWGQSQTQETGRLTLAEGIRVRTDVESPRGDGGLHANLDKLIAPRKDAESEFSAPLSAASLVVVDTASNSVLFSKNMDDVRSIASITKLMTALVFLDTSPDMSEYMTILPVDVREGPEYVESGDKLRVRDVFNTMLIGSSNTAAVALARHTGLPIEEFVARMNQKAKVLGLSQTVFAEPSGLDPANVSTARELSALVRYALTRETIVATVQREAYTVYPAGGTPRNVATTNWLMTGQVRRVSDATVVGGKTGYIDASGYNIAVTFKKSGHEITVVVLGCADVFARYTESDLLARWVFDHFTWGSEE